MSFSLSPARVGLVCFDIGGVIVRLCSTWADACGRAGVPLRPISRWEELESVVVRYHAGALTTALFAHELASLAEQRYTEPEVLAIHRGWLGEAYEGVDELVAEFEAAGVATAVLSNTNEEHWTALRELAAVRRIRHHVLSHEIHALKPAPEAFVAVERVTGVEPKRIVFFDDSPVNVAAASARGWKAFAVRPGENNAAQMREALASLASGA